MSISSVHICSTELLWNPPLSLPLSLSFSLSSLSLFPLTEVKELEAKRDAIAIEDEEKVTNYYRIRQQLQKLEREMTTHITKPVYCVPFLQPGRLVKVEHNDEDFGWGAVVNFQKKANQKVCELVLNSWEGAWDLQ